MKSFLGFTAKYQSRTVNLADPTEVATLSIKSDNLDIEIQNAWETVWFRIYSPFFGSHRFEFKADKIGLAILDFAKECSRYGTRRVFEIRLWNKFSQKIKLAWCALREHAWFAEDEGDAENGPKPPNIHCLRCGYPDIQVGTDIYEREEI